MGHKKFFRTGYDVGDKVEIIISLVFIAVVILGIIFVITLNLF